MIDVECPIDYLLLERYVQVGDQYFYVDFYLRDKCSFEISILMVISI